MHQFIGSESYGSAPGALWGQINWILKNQFDLNTASKDICSFLFTPSVAVSLKSELEISFYRKF